MEIYNYAMDQYPKDTSIYNNLGYILSFNGEK
jgi:Flp pilus assembly protein TadD